MLSIQNAKISEVPYSSPILGHNLEVAIYKNVNVSIVTGMPDPLASIIPEHCKFTELPNGEPRLVVNL